jgi:hypothetical protein
MNKTNLRRGGFYWKEGKPYLSVTTTLDAIEKKALRYWFGKEVYFAMLADPTIDEKEALSAPYKVSSKAKDRGSTIHSIIEAFKNTERRLEGIPQHIREYAFAFYDFYDDHKIEIVDREKSLFNDEHLIAGTLDLYVKMNNKHYILDVKTGKDIYQEAELQLSAYAYMMRKSGQKVDHIGVVLLETGKDGLPTGKYKFQTMTERFDIFLAVKQLYCWLNREKLTKLNYKG